MSSVYQLNRGIGASLEFKGLKAQYIGYYAALLLGLLITFTVLYVIGCSAYICLAFVAITGTAVSLAIVKLNKKHGRHGLMQWWAKRQMPTALRLYTRKIYY